MSTVTEVGMSLQWIVATLKADSQWVALSPGGVHRGMLPVGTLTPATIIAFQSGVDVVFANAVRSSVDATYQIKGVGTSDQTQAVFDLAARIDDLFKRAKGTTTGGSIIRCYRINPLAYDDTTAGIQYMHAGGLYRIRSQDRKSVV